MSRDWKHYARAVSREFDVPYCVLVGRDAHRKTARARQALYHIMRHERGLMFEQIGNILKRDHSTVRQGAELAAWCLVNDPEFAARYRRALA